LAESLFKHSDFMKLWIGQTISVFGAQFSPIAIQFAALYMLNAQRIQYGILSAAGTVPFLIFGLPVGVWADRYRKKRTMIVANIARAIILASVPLAWLVGVLSMTEFYVVAFVTGVLAVFFEICYQSYLPTLVERSQLVDANSKLQTSQATGGGIGPALAGAVVSVVSAPLAIFGDVVGYICSVGFLSSIKKTESVVLRVAGRSTWADMREGLAIVAKDVRLRSIVGCSATASLFSQAYGAILIPFMVQDFGFGAFEVGLVLSASAVGGILGAAVSQRIPRRIGVGPTIILSAVGFSVIPIGLYFAAGDDAFPVLAVVLSVSSFAAVVYNVSQVSFRQALVSIGLQGRINATNRTIVWGMLPVGGLLGGVLAQVFGYHLAVGICVFAGLLAILWVLFSPVRRIREIPGLPEIESSYAASAPPSA